MPFKLLPTTHNVEVDRLRTLDLDTPFVAKLRSLLRDDVLHLKAPDKNERVRTDGVCAHCGPRVLPAGSVFELAVNPRSSQAISIPSGMRVFVDGVGLVSSWMASVLASAVREGRMPKELVIPRLSALIMELCGCFARDPYDSRCGEISFGMMPIETPQQAIEALSGLSYVKGSRTALRSLRLCEANAASPMEAALFIAFTFPPLLGGFHLPRPVVNAELELSKHELAHIEGRGLCPDFWWEDFRVAFEYEGKDYHGGLDSLHHDRQKMRDYHALDIQPVPATYEDVRTPKGLERIALLLAREMDTRMGTHEVARVRRIIAREEYARLLACVWSALLPPLRHFEDV